MVFKQLEKGNWKVYIFLGMDLNGKRKRISKQGFKTKKDAELYANDIMNKHNKGLISPQGANTLFKDFMVNWFDNIKSDKLALNSKNDYLSRMNNHILPMLGKYKLCELNTDIIQQFYDDLIHRKGMKAASAKKVLDMVQVCLKYAIKKRLIYTLPTSEIEKEPIKKPMLQVWNKDQLEFFLDYIGGSRLYTPVLIDALTGLRIGELCGLQWKDIDLKNGIITVSKQLIHDKRLNVYMLSDLKTQSSRRIITIPNILTNYLKKIKATRKDDSDDYVIQSEITGSFYSPRSLSMRFTRAVNKFTLPKEEYKGPIENYMQLPQISFHGLRHTHATLLIANGENIKVVSDRLGHASITMTLNTYTHVLDDMKSKTAALLDDIFK